MARAAVSELVVPLRNAWNITRYKRAPRAMQIIKNEVVRHLKVREDEEVWIDPSVNEAIWSRGIENPPRKIRLQVTRHDEPDIPIEVKLMEECKWVILDQHSSNYEQLFFVKNTAKNSLMTLTTTRRWSSN